MGNTRKNKRSQKEILRKLGVRSGLEDKVKKDLEERGVLFEYETYKLRYTIPAMDHTYRPDFIVYKRSGKPIFIETKGRWEKQDRYKHLLLRQQHPEYDIRFIFSRAGNRLSKGSTTTYRDLCEGNGRGVWKDLKWKYSDGGVIDPSWLEE